MDCHDGEGVAALEVDVVAGRELLLRRAKFLWETDVGHFDRSAGTLRNDDAGKSAEVSVRGDELCLADASGRVDDRVHSGKAMI